MSPKLGQMRIASATNARTLVVAFVDSMPCGDTVVTIRDQNLRRLFSMIGLFNSLAFDWQARLRVGGLHLDEHVLMAMPFVQPKSKHVATSISDGAIALCCPLSLHSVTWLNWETETRNTQNLFRLPRADAERRRLTCVIEALAAYVLGFSFSDFFEVLHECDHSPGPLRSDVFTRTLDPKGFWRVDKEMAPELRHTVLSLVAFHDLQEKGLDAFLAQNDGEGWMLPETLRLADYGLGHDDRAKEPQPVASRLGPRFLPWQLEGSVGESWEECRRHAENIRLIRAVGAPDPAAASGGGGGGGGSDGGGGPVNLFSEPEPIDLFGVPLAARRKKRR